MTRVLIVEDETELLFAWAEGLRQSGNTVVTAENGVEALRELGTGTFDVLVFDLFMPRLSGIDAIKLIRRTDPDTPLIAVTAAQDAGVTRAVLDAGVTELLLKPFSLDDLAAAIARAARQKL
ncbi:MAG TPA: response regulator [Anaerolineales bacterium]|nr:response regulator [Anaerolineales bacterium]